MKKLQTFLMMLLICSCQPEQKQQPDEITADVDNILVEKAHRKMYLRHGEDVVREYKISLGRQPVGAKVKSGDNKTPEGKYHIVNHNPHSKFHLSLKISYPNQEQKTFETGKFHPKSRFTGYPVMTVSAARFHRPVHRPRQKHSGNQSHPGRELPP